MPNEWTPPKEDAEVFARYKAHVEGERELKPEMEKLADRALAAGATVGQLARHTGLTPEVFRRRARKLGIELKRPPTVGRLAPAPAEPPSRPAAPAPRSRVVQPVPEPPKDDRPVLTDDEAHSLVQLARRRGTDDQRQRLHRTSVAADAKGSDPDLEVIEAAFEMGLLTDADIVAVREQLAAEQPRPAADATEES